MMHRTRPALAVTFALLALGTAPSAQAPIFDPAAAQTPISEPGADMGSRRAGGWMFTPALVYGGSYDDNALVREKRDVAPGDYTTSINPSGELAFNGRRGDLLADYGGTFVEYRELTSLNSFNQRGSISARRLMTRRVTLFARSSATAVPTTELLGVVGIPFLRLGSRLADARGGLEARLSKRTSLMASYAIQWVDFDRNPLLGLVLLGGHSQGGSLSVRHALSKRVSLIAGSDLQRAWLVDGDRFNVQTTQGGVELRPWESVTLFGAIGFSRLDLTGLASRTGPAWRLGLTRRLRTSTVEVLYSRSFVPSYGFGGTTQNEQLTSSLIAPFGRHFYTRSSLSWGRNEPLVEGGLKLTSAWIEGSLGYVLRPWVRVEGYYNGMHQNIEIPGGLVDRNLVGFQIITTKPTRIR
jgi:hypothetical protein